MWMGVKAFALAILAGACVPGIQSFGSIRSQEDWNLRERSDGGIVVTLRAPRNPEVQRVAGRDIDPRTLNERISDARKTYEPWSVVGDPQRDYVELDDGVVSLRGVVQSEDEAARMIDAALHTPGVTGVISYLSWPGHRPWDGVPPL
jgi:hypothetical protein